MTKIYIQHSIKTNNFNDPDCAKKISELWTKSLKNPDFLQTPEKFGVYYNYESDFKGNYQVGTGTKTLITKNFVLLENLSFQVFSVDFNDLENPIFETWKRIWQLETENKINRAYKIDFERYFEKNKCEIHISIN